ncbi:MAG: hypothetical protein PHY14_04410 [Candidatus Gracilibacteria bacterium]|nr:hypothetical protein [Candidatus Gracilibacteria bacterium]
MRVLYINPLRSNIECFFLEGDRLLDSFSIPKGDDFSTFPDTIMTFMEAHNIDEFWVILGPGAFTRMRIITLTLSSLILSRGIIVKGCHFFQLIEKNIPIIQANNEEYIIRNDQGNSQHVPRKNLPPGIYEGYGSQNDFTDKKVLIEYAEDWEKLGKIFSHLSPTKTLIPFYLKEPHITCSTKNTSRS